MNLANLFDFDKEVTDALLKEKERQNFHLELIASENYASKAVLQAQGSIFTNKYAEGYPGKRYYGGCEFSDIVENLAIDRAKEIFGAEHANVQPHSGANANTAVMLSTIVPGDTILGMNLSHGGHLTHGSKVNLSGKYFNAFHYGVDAETGYINYDEVRKIALECKPKLLIAGASAYPRKIDFARFRSIADEVGAILLVDMAHIAGLVAAGLHESPIPHAQIVSTTTHKTLRGPRGGMILCNSDYAKKIDKAVFPGLQGGPLVHVIAAKAVAFKEALDPSFKEYQQQVITNAQVLSKTLMDNGVSLISGGTDNHLMLIDLRPQNLTGKEIEKALSDVKITVNMNTIPNDPQKPTVTSGIRIGTPALTTRGMKETEMKIIGEVIASIVNAPNDIVLKEKNSKIVKELCDAFKVYEDLY